MADESNKPQLPKDFVNAQGLKLPLNIRQLTQKAQLRVFQDIKEKRPLTNEENELYDKLKNNEGDSVDVLRNDKDLKEKKQTVDDKERKFFEEDDILNYLYKHWLLDGANWICDKTTKGIEKTTKSVATWAWDTGKDAWEAGKQSYKDAKEGKKPDNSMTRYAAAIDKTSEEQRKQNCNIYNAALAKFDEQMDRFSHTFDADPNTQVIPTEQDLNDPTYQVLIGYADKYGAKRAQDLCRRCSEMKHKEISNLLSINYIAVALTRAQHIQQNLGMETPETTLTPEQYATETKRNMYLIARQLNASTNPTKTLEDMVKKVDKANKTANESLTNGRYLSNNNKKWRKSPINNKALDRLNKFLDIDENNQVSAQVQQEIQIISQTAYGQLIDHADNPQTMVERLIGEQTQQQSFAAAVENQKNKENIEKMRRMNLEARRKYFQKWLNRHNNVNSNDNSRSNQGQLQVNRNGGDSR